MRKEEKAARRRSLVLPGGRTVGDEIAGFDVFSRLLDSRFSVGNVKFGADSLLGLIPVAGDVTTAVTGLYALVAAVRLRLPASASVQILWNILFDMSVGAIPVAGDIFDFFNRSNRKNFHLVERHLVRRAEAYAASLTTPS
ncbi:MAG: DUF4112 domain-containing protein [Hyphomonas sp.]|nr:DUF4112 domain-containing protein [Hyphomonas sp.]MCA8903428.1 DUF4112 domain-containing protein [Hyphomonas sp.]MCB9962035.1 DUF4112 domain-containing protein [Hyphomonas sp.]MCB9971027.1 DUF4112 domain-containing protein [Hyphomonas sp.]